MESMTGFASHNPSHPHADVPKAMSDETQF